MARDGRGHDDFGRFPVTDLADHHHVGVLAEDGPQSFGKAEPGSGVDLDLCRAGQVVTMEVSASDEWQEFSRELPVNGTLIHLRVLLPAGESSIRRIRIQGGEAIREWDFAS